MEIFGQEILTATGGDIKKVLGEHLDKVVVCMETATGLSGTSNLKMTDNIQVYCETELDIKDVKVEKVTSLSDIDTVIIEGIRCTSVEQTLKDLLDTMHDRDYAVALEALADYYYTHDESFDSVKEKLTSKQIKTLEECMEDILDYYNMG